MPAGDFILVFIFVTVNLLKMPLIYIFFNTYIMKHNENNKNFRILFLEGIAMINLFIIFSIVTYYNVVILSEFFFIYFVFSFITFFLYFLHMYKRYYNINYFLKYYIPIILINLIPFDIFFSFIFMIIFKI